MARGEIGRRGKQRIKITRGDEQEDDYPPAVMSLVDAHVPCMCYGSSG